ncbi:MAG: esterase/lipase family protein [Alphaproteobacteria bacterium]
MSLAGHDIAIVLLHGYLGFLPDAYWSRFAAIHRAFERRGCAVHRVRQPATADLGVRAENLASRLRALPHDRLVLVGHSMGGLDARLAAHAGDPERRIAQVLTIGTPHRGTAAAEWLLERSCLEGTVARWLDRGGLENLLPPRMAAFNAAVPDRADVGYRAVAGWRAPQRLSPPWCRIARHLRRCEGDNDGVVSVASAAWGSHLLEVEADHLQLVGMRPLSGADVHGRLPRHFVRLRRLLEHMLADADARR